MTAGAKQDRRMGLVLFAIAFVLLGSGAFWGLPSGKSVVGGWRVANGEVPYRDFWTMYAPGQFYLAAAILKAIGREVVFQGLAAALLRAATVAVFYGLARRAEVGRRPAILLSSALLLAFWKTAPGLTSHPPALLLGLIGHRALLVGLQRSERRERSFLAAGASFGAAAFFKHDVGAYFTIAACLALVAQRVSMRSIVILIAGAAAPVLLTVSWLTIQAGRPAWEDLVVFPLRDFAGVREEPFPGLLPELGAVRGWLARPGSLGAARDAAESLSSWALCTFPAWIALGALASLLLRWTDRDRPNARIALLWIAPIPFFWMAAHVQQNTHPLTMGTFCLLLGGIGWSRAIAGGKRVGVRWAWGVGTAAQAAALLVAPALSFAQLLVELRGSAPLGLPGTAGIRVPARDLAIYRPIVRFLASAVPPGEPIYCGLWRHDAVVISNQWFYYLADRPNPTRHGELHPGITDREDVQREIAAALETSGVRCVVLWRFGWSDERLDAIRDRNARAVPGAGSTFLDEYLREHFEPIARHGEYIVAWKRGAAPPEPAPDASAGPESSKGAGAEDPPPAEGTNSGHPG